MFKYRFYGFDDAFEIARLRYVDTMELLTAVREHTIDTIRSLSNSSCDN